MKTKKSYGVRFINCYKRCPGGNRCICNASFLHVYHICSDPYCKCHSAEVLNPPKNVPIGMNVIKVSAWLK